MKNSIKNLFVLSLLVFGLLSFNLKITRGDWNLDRNGNLVSTPKVLGESDSQTETSTPEVQKPEPTKTETKTDTKTETTSDTSKKNEDPKVILPTGNPVKEVKNADIKSLDISVNDNNNKLKVDIETIKSKKIESEQDSFTIEDLNDDDNIKISTSESKGDFDVEKNKVKATVGFPVSINPTSKQLIVKTPDGDKTVDILPDKVASITAGLKLLDNPESNSNIHMVSDANGLVYQVDGSKEKKLLGLLPVQVKKMVVVSTQDGNIISVNEDFFNKLLDLLSI